MIGEKIQNIRQRRGMTLSELAERATISKSYLSNIERNINQNPSIQIVEKIATVLDVDFRMLIGIKSVAEELPENEWLDFINELKQSGVGIEQLKEYKTVIEFVHWQNEHKNKQK